MKLTNSSVKLVSVSPATLGERLRLCGVRPYYEYNNGNRTDTILGYTYTVTCSGSLANAWMSKSPESSCSVKRPTTPRQVHEP